MFGFLALAAVAFGMWALISAKTDSGWEVTITVTPTVPENGREAFLQTLQSSLGLTSRLESVSYQADKTVVVVRNSGLARPPEGIAMLGSYSLRSEVSP